MGPVLGIGPPRGWMLTRLPLNEVRRLVTPMVDNCDDGKGEISVGSGAEEPAEVLAWLREMDVLRTELAA
jgi:hypothetical protein